MLDDVYNDQIMQHPSRGWSPRLFDALIKDLKGDGWLCRRRSTIDLDLYHPSRDHSILVHVMHQLDDNTARPTILISDVVFQKPHVAHTIAMHPEVFGEFHADLQYTNCLPGKKYNCLINRGCRFRQSWLYHLARLDLLDQGHVSYWCEDRFGGQTPAQYFDTLLQGNEIFAQEHEILRHQIPFKNFTIPVEHAIIDSTVSLVIETWFDNNDIWCFSEKIWRSLQMPRPWMMLASKHSVRYLRDLGFDVLDDYVDHSYDDAIDPVDRQMIMLDQLVNMPSLTTHDLQDLEARAQHNRDMMRQLRLAWPGKYQKILQQIRAISNSDSPT